MAMPVVNRDIVDVNNAKSGNIQKYYNNVRLNKFAPMSQKSLMVGINDLNTRMQAAEN